MPLASPDFYTTLTKVRYPDGTLWWVVTLITLRDERIIRAESYFAPELGPEQLRGGTMELAPRDGSS